MGRPANTVDVTRLWVIKVREVPGVVIQARTLSSVEDEVRDGLAMQLDVDFDSFDLEVIVNLTDISAADALAEFSQRRTAREAAERAYADAAASNATALKNAGVSTRDAAALMNMSHQRVQQLTTASPRSGRAARASRSDRSKTDT